MKPSSVTWKQLLMSMIRGRLPTKGQSISDKVVSVTFAVVFRKIKGMKDICRSCDDF